MKTRFRTLICILCLICSISPVFTACNREQAGIVDANINDSGELILVYQDGTKQNLGVVVGKDGANGTDGTDGADGTTVITGDTGAIPVACAKGLRSAVSIVCNFTTTIQNSGFRPGWGSTRTEEYSSRGSGVIYQLDREQGDAFIITNYHVVYDTSSDTANGVSDDISVYLYGSAIEEKAINATYVGGSAYYDIAVLRVEDSPILQESNACAVDTANSDDIVVGDSAIAIGNAEGLGISASVGVVSVDSEYITMTAADGRSEVSFRVMRVDAAVNSGNSGGGLYDAKGNLIGIVNAKIVDDGVENIGYAIPSNVAVSIAENIIDYCYETEEESVQRVLLGITVAASDSKAVYEPETGLIRIQETVSVYEVSKGSLAEGKLQTGDILLSATVGGQKMNITRQYHIIDMMLDVRAGDTVELEILRDGAETSVSILVTEDCLTAY